MRPASSPRAATMVAACCGLCAALPAHADTELQPLLRDTRADFGRADLRPALPVGSATRAVGVVDPTIGNPNPWAGLIGLSDIFDGFETYAPHTSLAMEDWVPLSGQSSLFGSAWQSGPDYVGVVDNAIAQTGPNWNPGGTDFDRHGVLGGPDSTGSRSRFLAAPRGTIDPQALITGNSFMARVNHPLRVPSDEQPLTILLDFYLDDISTFTWFRPASFTEGFIVTSVFMGGFDFVYFQPFVNEDNIADRLIILGPKPGGFDGEFFGAADPHRIVEREWFTIGIRLATDSFSVWVRDTSTIGVNGFEQDSIYDAFPGDPARGAFAGEIFAQDWLQFFPGVDDDPATASVEGAGAAFNAFNQLAQQITDDTGSPAAPPLFARSIDALQLISGSDPTSIAGFQPHDWYADNYTVLGAEFEAGDPPPFCVPFLDDLESYETVSIGLLDDSQWSGGSSSAVITSGQNHTPGGSLAIREILVEADDLFGEMFARQTPPVVADLAQPASFSVFVFREDTLAPRAIFADDNDLLNEYAARILLGARTAGVADDRVYARVANPNFDAGQPVALTEGPSETHTNGVNTRDVNVPLVDDQGAPITTPVGQWFEVRGEIVDNAGAATTLRIFIDGVEAFPDGTVEGVTALTSPTHGFDELDFWTDRLANGLFSTTWYDDIAVDGPEAIKPTPLTVNGLPYTDDPAFALPYEDALATYAPNRPLARQGATPWLNALFTDFGGQVDVIPLESGAVVDESTLGYFYTVNGVEEGTPPAGVSAGATVFVVDNIAPPAPPLSNPVPGVMGLQSPVRFIDEATGCLVEATATWTLNNASPQAWDGSSPVAGRYLFTFGRRWLGAPGVERIVESPARSGAAPLVEIVSPTVSADATVGDLDPALTGTLPAAAPGPGETARLSFDLWIDIDDPAIGPRGRLAWELEDSLDATITRFVFGGPNNFVDENTFDENTGAITPGPDGLPDNHFRSESQSDPRFLHVLRPNPLAGLGRPDEILERTTWQVPGGVWIRCDFEIDAAGDWVAVFDDGADGFIITGSSVTPSPAGLDQFELSLGFDPGADGARAAQPITWTSLGAAAAPEGGAAPLSVNAGSVGSFNTPENPIYFYFEISEFWPGATNLPQITEVDISNGAPTGTRALEPGDTVALWNDQSTASFGGPAGTPFLDQIAINPTFRFSADGGATISARGDWTPLGLPGEAGINDPVPRGGIVNDSPAYHANSPFVEILIGSIAEFPSPGPAPPAAHWRIDNVALAIIGCTGDLSGDATVDGADLGLLLGAWGSSDAAADLTGDGVVDGADLGLLLGAWGVCP